MFLFLISSAFITLASSFDGEGVQCTSPVGIELKVLLIEQMPNDAQYDGTE